MVHKFWYAGRCCRDFGIYVSGQNTFNGPEKDYETQEIPGRNGALLISKNRYKNISVSYPAFIRSKFCVNSDGARAWLLGTKGYQKLEDDYHPDTYRLAHFSGPIDFDMRFLNRSGEVELIFDCKPQRFLKSGEFPIKIQSGQSLYNAWQPALPLIQITGIGDGQLVVGKNTVNITGMTGNLMLDSEVQNAYDGTTNKNNSISILGGFPMLQHGESLISYSGGITAVNITPRWWML